MAFPPPHPPGSEPWVTLPPPPPGVDWKSIGFPPPVPYPWTSVKEPEGGPPYPPYGGYGYPNKKCWTKEVICGVDIKTGACATGFCDFEIKLQRTTKIYSSPCRSLPTVIHPEGEDICPEINDKKYTRRKEECEALLFGEPGTNIKHRCKVITQKCSIKEGDTGSSDFGHWNETHTVDFNCGFGARGGERAKRHKKLTQAVGKCLEKGTDEEKCEKVCSLADMTNAPEDGGIGNKERCREICNIVTGHISPSLVRDIASYGCTENCEDNLSAKLLNALDKWLKDNC